MDNEVKIHKKALIVKYRSRNAAKVAKLTLMTEILVPVHGQNTDTEERVCACGSLPLKEQEANGLYVEFRQDVRCGKWNAGATTCRW